MLGSTLNVSATFDQAIDRASMSLDYLRLNNEKEYNEDVLLNHIAKLESLLAERKTQYNELVNQANAEINRITNEYKRVSHNLSVAKIELEKEKLNSFDITNKVKTLSNVNRAYIHGIKHLDQESQLLAFKEIKNYIEKGSNNSSLMKIKF